MEWRVNPALVASAGPGFGKSAVPRHHTVLRLALDWMATAGGRLALGAVVLAILHAAWLLSGASPDHRILVSNLFSLPIVLAASVSSFLMARVPGVESRVRRAWTLTALAFACYSIGNVWWTVLESANGGMPTAAASDLVYLAYYPLFFAGLMSFPSVRRTRAEAIKLSLDVSTVVLAGGAVIWYVILAPALKVTATSPWETAITLAYPIGDLVLLFGSALALLHRPPPASRHALALLALGGLVMFVTDLGYGHIVLAQGKYVSGHPVDLGWQLASVLWFLAAQYQRFSLTRAPRRVEVEPHYRGISLLPYAALAAGFGLLIDAALPLWSTSLAVIVCAVLLISATVVVRQVLAAHEVARLVAERNARESRFSSLVQHSSDVISILDRAGTLRFVSPSVGRVFGWHFEGLVGRDIASLLHPDDIVSARVFLRNLAEQPGSSASFVCRLQDGEGAWRHVESMATSLLNDPTVAGIVLNTRDVSDRTRLEAELTRRAYNDPLTGLANRVRFHALTEQSLRRPHRKATHVGVIFLDLDNFKNINDSMGHLHGDQLLIEVAARLLNATRGCDTVSRLGGDEFAVLLESLAHMEDAIPVAERITQAMKRPFTLGGSEVVVGASLGIAISYGGITADELLRDADVAMYVAKRNGKGGYAIFEPEMQVTIRNNQELEADLRHALDRDELVLAFQPIVDLRDGRVVSAEALLRWEHPVRGFLQPDAFIHTATESGLIVPIGRWVLRAACQQLADWRLADERFADLCITVNVAGRQLQADSFPMEVATALEVTGLPANRLVLEITEGEIMKETQSTLARLHALKALGVRIAIDDFGTGYSSLSYLQRFPVDVLKIDKTFIDQCAHEGHGQALARMILALGETLGMMTIAEGVQDRKQAEALRAMRCELAQGYYFSRPLTATQFSTLLGRGHLESQLVPLADPEDAMAGLTAGTAMAAIRSLRGAAA